MPAKNQTKHPQHVIEAAVKRHLDGESVAVLAKYYKISRAAFYNWITKVKKDMLLVSDRKGMSPKEVELMDSRARMVELEHLRLENRKLKDKVFEMMVRHGEL
jgi:transposase